MAFFCSMGNWTIAVLCHDSCSWANRSILVIVKCPCSVSNHGLIQTGCLSTWQSGSEVNLLGYGQSIYRKTGHIMSEN